MFDKWWKNEKKIENLPLKERLPGNKTIFNDYFNIYSRPTLLG